MSGLGKRTKIFTGNANPKLAKKICNYLDCDLGDADIQRFSDGEIRVEINETVRGRDVIIIQPTSAPANDNIMELLIMVDALKRSAAKRITAVIPYYGYSRQDRRPDYTRTPITSRMVADMLQVAGVKQVISTDIHSGQQQGFFKIPFINLSAAPEIVADVWKHHSHNNDICVVSPDTGGVARARAIAKQLDNAELAIIDKRRPEANVSQVMNVIGDVEGKRCIIIDDMIDTAGTLAKGAAALKERGASYIAAYATHAVLSGVAYDNIENSCIDEVVITDTIMIDEEKIKGTKIRVLSMAGLIAESLLRIHNRKSVSEIYKG